MKIDKSPEFDENQEGFPATYLRELRDWLDNLHSKLYEDDIVGSATWDPGNTVGIEEAGEHYRSTTVTVTGAKLGDYAIVSSSVDISAMILTADVTSADTVTITMLNPSRITDVDLGSITIYVRVFRRTT
jgi:hypothetical protein